MELIFFYTSIKVEQATLTKGRVKQGIANLEKSDHK